MAKKFKPMFPTRAEENAAHAEHMKLLAAWEKHQEGKPQLPPQVITSAPPRGAYISDGHGTRDPKEFISEPGTWLDCD